MAIYRAISNGNWSSLAIWQDNSGGSFVASTVLPSAVDTVYMNNFVVQANIDINIDRLLSTTITGVNAGGTLNVTTNRNIIANTEIRMSTGATDLIDISGTGLIVIITSLNIYAGSINCIELATTNSTLNINGNITGSNTSNTGYGLHVTGTGNTINIVGNQITAGNNNGYPIRINASGNTLNITGNQNSNSSQVCIQFATSSNLNVTGNQTATSSGPAIAFVGGTHTVNIIGNQQGSNSNIGGRAINCGTGTNAYIKGNCYAGTQATGIASAGLLTYEGGIYNNSDKTGILAEFLNIANLVSTFWQIKDNVSATMVTLANTASIPTVGDVRQGVNYTAGNTGTLIVPSPSNVRKGVATDDTVGTADLTAEDMWDYLASNITTAGSIGKLVKDNLDVAVSTRLASASYVAPDNADIAAIKAVTDTLTDVATETTSLLIKDKTNLIPNNPASVESVGAIVASYNI
jgi:hypothetical protein